MTPTATEFDRAEAAILEVMQSLRVADPNRVMDEARNRVEVSRDALTGALQTLVGQRKIRFNGDLQLELNT